MKIKNQLRERERERERERRAPYPTVQPTLGAVGEVTARCGAWDKFLLLGFDVLTN